MTPLSPVRGAGQLAPTYCAEVIARALKSESVWVPMPQATQPEIDAMRARLHAAALAQVEPIEIITRTVVGKDTGFIVRRFRG